MYQFTFTPFRLLSSHRGVEAHVDFRTAACSRKIVSVSARSQPLSTFSFIPPTARSVYPALVACHFTRSFILFPLPSVLIISTIFLRSIPQFSPGRLTLRFLSLPSTLSLVALLAFNPTNFPSYVPDTFFCLFFIFNRALFHDIPVPLRFPVLSYSSQFPLSLLPAPLRPSTREFHFSS